MDEQVEELIRFLEYIWGDESGFVYLPVHHKPFGPRDWEKRFFSWPRAKDNIVKHILKYSAIGDNIFYAPALFKQARPLKEDVKLSRVLYVDFDGNAPTSWPYNEVPEPTLRVQSSIEGHEHCYWLLDKPITNVETLEDRNRALAYQLGADTSGWDADQILRPAGVLNAKRGVMVHIMKGYPK